jgi:ABC-type glutathione transport system ATPase component
MKKLAAVEVVKRFAGVVAVDGVSLDVGPGETVALVGESGSGKSTLGRLLVGLLRPDAGRVQYGERVLAEMSRAELVGFRRDVQIIFQDPYASLNPRLTVGSMLREVLTVHELAEGAGADARVSMLLDRVGLDPAAVRRYPHEFSGGQRQRLCIARALAVEPRIIVADEPVSALDVSVQAKVLGLLKVLQRELDLGYLFISHDLAVVRRLADRVAVMRDGRIVEAGPVATVYSTPVHDYTKALLAAVPRVPLAT